MVLSTSAYSLPELPSRVGNSGRGPALATCGEVVAAAAGRRSIHFVPTSSGVIGLHRPARSDDERPMMKTPPFLLLCSLAMVLLVVCLFLTPEGPQEAGYDHPNLPANTISVAPDGERHTATLLWVGSLFGVCVALFSVGILDDGIES